MSLRGQVKHFIKKFPEVCILEFWVLPAKCIVKIILPGWPSLLKEHNTHNCSASVCRFFTQSLADWEKCVIMGKDFVQILKGDLLYEIRYR